MTAALTAYLERLVHPARKAYAVAYAEHVTAGAAKLRVPKSLDADTAAKIACKVTRYAKDTTAPAVAAPEGLEHLPEAVRAYAAEHGDSELLGLVDAFVSQPVADGETAEQVGAHERLAAASELVRLETIYHSAEDEYLGDYYTPEYVPAFVDTAEVDVLDLTGLEPSMARELALKLARWNGGGRVYNRRAGRRYLHRDIRRLDLNDSTVMQLPNYDDLVATLKVRGVYA